MPRFLQPLIGSWPPAGLFWIFSMTFCHRVITRDDTTYGIRTATHLSASQPVRMSGTRKGSDRRTPTPRGTLFNRSSRKENQNTDTYCMVSGPILTTSNSFPVRRFRVFSSSSFHRESGAPDRNQFPPLSAKIIP